MQLVRTEQEVGTLRSENKKLNEMLKLERGRTDVHTKKRGEMEFKIEELEQKLLAAENLNKELTRKNNQKQCKINQIGEEQRQMKEEYRAKLAAEKEKLAREYERMESELQVS